MIVSLNEIEATVLKAARGAGYPWGLAEEAGAAARWLASHGLPWLETIDTVLDPAIVALCATAEDGTNPLAAGAFLADHHFTAESSKAGRPVAAPLWLAGVLAANNAGRQVALTISWPGAEIVIEGRRLIVVRGDMTRSSPTTIDVSAAPVQAILATDQPSAQTRNAVDPDRWNALLALEKRTYVPATDQSRIAGAGAGLSDND